ncbi:MAG: sensor histidine kinase [Salinivirgaceae bacterium]|jgi:hypothetical protein|nr:sensor histidine kinase [Salinivirgaceae bacterium]
MLSISNKWFIRIGVAMLGLAVGYFIQPKQLEKYRAKVFNGTFETLADGQKIAYIDVDNDQNSEEFIYYHLSDNRQPVINQYSSSGEYQNVWYLEGEVAENFDFISGDYNKDSINEIYTFSFYRNCLCLYGLIPGSSNQFLPEKLIIHEFGINTNFSYIFIHSGGVADLNNDGFGEVIFSVNSRFSETPRCVFAYDIANDTLLKSPELGLQLVGSPIIYDFDKDQFPEIFLATLNSTNQAWASPREQAQYSTSVVLQNDLSYYMVPALFENRMSVTATFPVESEPENFIGVLSWPLKKEGHSQLTIMNRNSDIIQQQKMSPGGFIFDPKRALWDQILLFKKNGEISQFSPDLTLKNKVRMHAPINQVAFLDIDNDGHEEPIIVENNRLTIYSNNFSNPVKIEIPGLNVQKVSFSVKQNQDSGHMLSLQNHNQQYLISYSKNKYYWLQYLVYIASVLSFYFVYFIIRKIHYNQVDQIKDDNEKFYQMQMELIRNQLDPHFLFNALNSISFSINKDERKVAYSNLGLFAKFLRESIITLDDFSRSLEEEIDYVKNYLNLEKFRFKEKFDYDFIVGPGVIKGQKVPKLILFSFIESALKKSVLPKNTGGRIEITIDHVNGKGIFIMISDTGLYRNLEGSMDSHTKNMQMMARIVSYFNQHNIYKIAIKYRDLGTSENPKGGSVEITIPSDYKYIV